MGSFTIESSDIFQGRKKIPGKKKPRNFDNFFFSQVSLYWTWQVGFGKGSEAGELAGRFEGVEMALLDSIFRHGTFLLCESGLIWVSRFVTLLC